MVKKLLPCIGKYKKYALLSPFFIILEVILEILIPYTMSQIINIGIKGSGGLSYIFKMGGVMIVMACLSLVCGALAGKFAAVAAAGFSKGVREKLFNKICDFSFSNTDKFSTASLITRMTTDVTNTQMAFQMSIRMLVRAPVTLVSAAAMAFFINKRLSLVFLGAIPFLAVALFIIMTSSYPLFGAMLEKYDRLNSDVQENLMAIRVVKAFVRGDYENEKFEKAADDVRASQLKAEGVILWSAPVMQFVMYACMIAVSWFGGKYIIEGTMLTGDLMSFISYITQILMSLMMLAMIFVMLVISRASIKRIVEVFDELPDIPDNTESSLSSVPNGSVRFENVCFGYSKGKDKEVLTDINLDIKSGETIGIIGGTGSSKTTLVSLIPRLYDVSCGRVLVGGYDVKDYSLKTLRNEVSVVLQKNVLFSGTIKENLKWGNENASDSEIYEAAEIACAHDFIMSFPEGYDTVLGQGGVNLSGGQKQRLCIARALLKKPKIIILDDSTSAVDMQTDSEIRHALKTRLKDTTAIIIAQRISSVCDASKIIVMDAGKINGVGTHEELYASNDIYREVCDSQQKGDE